MCTGPGSANVLGGTFTAIKTVGERVDNMIVKEAVAMKCAFGENPKRCYKDKCDSTRMSTAAFLRGALASARDYGARKAAANGDVTKMPAYNQKLEALLPVLDHTIPLKAHAHQANDIFTAIRIAKEFDVGLTLEHVTEGHLIVDELAKESNIPMAVGPSLTFASKFELQNKSWERRAFWQKQAVMFPSSPITQSFRSSTCRCAPVWRSKPAWIRLPRCRPSPSTRPSTSALLTVLAPSRSARMQTWC